MKCLSLKQPFAELLVTGKKTIELRKWRTKFRGEFLIHASRTVDESACRENGFDPNSMTTGAVIGKAVLYDVKDYKSSGGFLADKEKHLASKDYLDDRYGFLIKDAIKFEKPMPMKGQLNFFEVSI